MLHVLSSHTEFELAVYPGTGLKVCVVVGECVRKPILVFYFGPNQAFGLRLRLGPSRTICSQVKYWVYDSYDHIDKT
jgi:hypothetical protein